MQNLALAMLLAAPLLASANPVAVGSFDAEGQAAVSGSIHEGDAAPTGADATWNDWSKGLSTDNGAPRVWGTEALASVTAVPEPQTYVLMLAGLGAVGFVAYRRRRG
jgi:hypothetical protein